MRVRVRGVYMLAASARLSLQTAIFRQTACRAQPSSTKRSPHLPTIRISVGGIYFCNITNTGKQLCSPNESFVVVLEKG